MTGSGEKRKKLLWLGAFAILFIAQIGLLLFFGNKKGGFHEDEFYSYYSSNKTAGLFEPDREWLYSKDYEKEFMVLQGERFRYGLVAQMQSWDVHPPVYYFLLHTMCSLFPGVFSKWLGIAVNIIAFAINFWLLAWISLMLGAAVEDQGDGENKEKYRWTDKRLFLAWSVCAIWGFGAAVISSVMFIRMYQWLTVFIMLCAVIHLRVVMQQNSGKEKKIGISFYIPLMVTVYLGFLTQYYYIIFHVFMGIAFCIWLLAGKRGEDWAMNREEVKRRLLHCLKYGIACGVALGAAILSYPASLSHIFRGYRGTEAVSEFADTSNTWERLRFFYGLLNEYVFGNCLEWILLFMVLLFLTLNYRRKRGEKVNWTITFAPYLLLLFACLGYFFTISKTALLLGETSNRYQMPVYGLFILLLCTVCFVWGEKGAASLFKRRQVSWFLWPAIVTVMLLILDASMLQQGKVFFLYEEEAAMLSYAEENTDTTVLVLYHEGSAPNVWRLADELMKYDKIYLVSQGNQELLAEAEIRDAAMLVVYVADHPMMADSLEMVLQSAEQAGSYEEVAKKGLWSVYEFH